MSTDENISKVRELYVQAARINDDAARQAFLDQACGGQTELRQQVEKLIAARAVDRDNVLHLATADSMSGRNSFSPDGDELGETFQSHPEAMGAEKTNNDAIRGRIDISTHPMIGNYRLLEELGHGGMGTVYMAGQSQPVKRQVALKVIKPGMDSKEVIARFEAERQALAMMDHPHIARVLDGGTTDEGRPYFVMELVRGVPITEFCKRKSLSLRERLELFIDICHAVQHAHQKGIIHRDLKPGNILVTLHDGKPVVKVIDFGVAKALHQDLTDRTLFTHFSQMVGTPLYMAPEQAEMSGLGVDTRSDIYSLGVVLYELLTGTTPFDRDSMSELGIDGIRKLIQEHEPPRPSARLSTLEAANRSTIEDQRKLDTEDIVKQLNREVDWIVMKALEKDRERRYETANAFAADIQRYLNDEPVEACPPSASYRVRKYAKRHKGLLATAALLIAMLTTSTAVSGVFAYQANDAKKEAEGQREEAVAAQQLADKRLEQSRVDFDRALNSLDTIVEEVSSPEFAQLPGVEKVRSEILDKAMKFYQEIISEHDNDPYARAQKAIAHRRIARLRGSSNQPALQLEELNNSIKILETLIKKDPGNFEYESRLGDSLFGRLHASASPREQQLADAKRHLAIVLKGVELGRPECINDAPLVYLKVAEKLPAGSREEREMVDASLQFVRQHSVTPAPGAFSKLAKFALDSGDPDEAVKHYARCIEGYRSLASDTTRRLRYIERWLVTVNLRKLAKVHQLMEDSDQAERAFREAFDVATKIFLEYHANIGMQNAFVGATRDLTEFLETQNRSVEAAEIWHRALELKYTPAQLREAHAQLLSRTSQDPITALTETIETYPTISAYHRYRGACYRACGELELALKDFNRAVELRSHDDLSPFDRRAVLFVQMGDLDKAIADRQTILEQEEYSADAHYHFGKFYLDHLKDYQNAIVHFDKSFETKRDGYRFKRRALAHFQLGHYAEALADIGQAVELTPHDGSNFYGIPPQALAECPDANFRSGMLALADQAVEQFDNAHNRIGRAGLLAAVGRDDEAIADYDKAIELEPENYQWRTWRISYFGSNEQWENLLQEINDAIAIKPDHYQSHYQCALTTLARSGVPEYRKVCQAMFDSPLAGLDNDDGAAAHFTAWTCALAPGAVDDYEPAIKLARHAVEKEPDNRQYINGLGAILMRAEKYDEAKKQLEKAIEAGKDEDTSLGYIHYFLTMTHHALGGTKEAQAQLRKANEIAESELSDSPAWNRRLTLELLRKEAESLITPPQNEPDFDSKE